LYKLIRGGRVEDFTELLNQFELDGWIVVSFSVGEGSLARTTLYALLHKEEAKKERTVSVDSATPTAGVGSPGSVTGPGFTYTN
jgi:hypothetical protein